MLIVVRPATSSWFPCAEPTTGKIISEATKARGGAQSLSIHSWSPRGCGKSVGGWQLEYDHHGRDDRLPDGTWWVLHRIAHAIVTEYGLLGGLIACGAIYITGLIIDRRS